MEFRKMCCRIMLSVLVPVAATTQPLLAQDIENEKPPRKFTITHKIASISAGIFFGAMVGAATGVLVGDSRAYHGKFMDAFRGGLIGASIFPFLIYESQARSLGLASPLNGWYVLAGGNTTFSNYEAAKHRLGYSFGIGRSYHLGKDIFLQAEAVFNQKRFLLPSQKISYWTPSSHYLWNSDVDFSVAYIDIALLAKFRVKTFDRAGLNFAFGPAMSVQVLEKTDYIIHEREQLERGSRVEYDFGYISDEPGGTLPYFSLMAAIELEIDKLLLRASLNRTFHNSNQIFPLQNATRLHTLGFAVGYRFSK